MTALGAAIRVSDAPERQAWRTPRPLFDALHARFRFDVDAAADINNHLLPHYWTERDDGIAQLIDESNDHLRAWVNPPYGDIDPWIGAGLSRGHRGAVTVLLLPSRTDQAWFLRALSGEIWFSRGRVQFVPPPGVRPSSNSHGSVLVVFDPETMGRGLIRAFDAKTGAIL